MTRHRRGNTDGTDGGDFPWRAPGDERPARQPDPAGEYDPQPWGGPARGASAPADGAVGISDGWDDDPGAATEPPWERTSPPWELPGWRDAPPVQRAPGARRLGSGHPSGPLTSVSSGPLAPLPPAGPARPRPADAAGSDYPEDDRRYLRTGYTDPGHGGGPGDGGDIRSGYPNARHRGHSQSDGGFPAANRDPGEDYATGDYAGDDLGPQAYAGQDYRGGPAHAGQHYRGGPAYAGQDYRGGPAYAPDDDAGDLDLASDDYPSDDYPGEGIAGDYADGDFAGGDFADDDYASDDYAGDDYAGDRGHPRRAGHLAAEEAGYPGHQGDGYSGRDDHPGGRAEFSHRGGARDAGDGAGDHGYGDPGGWYGEVAEDQAWADDEDDDGFLPGLSSGTGSRGASAPGGNRTSRGGHGATRPRGEKSKRKGGLRRAAPWIALSVLVLVIAVVGGAGLYVYRTYLHPPDYSGPGTGSVTVHIASGETATQVGQQLLQLGVVASVRAFSNAAKASGHGTALEPGYYRLREHMNAALAFALLLKPSSRIQLSVLVPEGLRLYETIALLGGDTGDPRGYEQAIKKTAALGLPSYAKGNPEGYLYPDTYTVLPGTPPADVLREMTQAFDREAASVNLTKWAAHDGVTPGQIITIASLVQAEGKRPQDLPKIARVIYNRLNARMKLQLDSTVLYAMHSRAHQDTVAETQHVRSPYNTYLHAGLPPGPIDSPGPAAINAALHPAKGNWLYFVAVNLRTGQTKFTSSYTQFQAYEAELNSYLASHH